MASPMNFRRVGHGMGVITINGEHRLAVFGGYDGRIELDSVELYNAKTEKWEISSIKLNTPRFCLSSITVKLDDINSQL